MNTVSHDRPRFAALLISATGAVMRIEELESFETTKRDNGDAGTWSFTAPLALNMDAARIIGPMDLVALYAGRISTATSSGAATPEFSLLPPGNFSYGAAGAAVTKALATPSCVMIGMVDACEEDEDFEGGSASFSVSGRDLTKVLIDNDSFVPATIDGGGSNGSFAMLSNIVLHYETSGTQLLLDVLDVFVAKSPSAIARIVNDPNGVNKGLQGGGLDAIFASIAPYGYPWSKFLDTQKLDPDFKHLQPGILPNFSVQSGSAWQNITQLRNFPIARLFVNEVGQLIFDDTWSAWGNGSAPLYPAYAIAPSDVRSKHFRQGDDDVVTSYSISSSDMIGADQKISSSLVGVLNAEVSDLTRFGYRFTQFVSTYDPIDAFFKKGPNGESSLLAARRPILMQLHNDIWTASFTVKGNAKYRVGDRFATSLGGVHPHYTPTSPLLKAWYITEVRQSAHWGTDWTTTLEARFAQDCDPALVGKHQTKKPAQAELYAVVPKAADVPVPAGPPVVAGTTSNRQIIAAYHGFGGADLTDFLSTAIVQENVVTVFAALQANALICQVSCFKTNHHNDGPRGHAGGRAADIVSVNGNGVELVSATKIVFQALKVVMASSFVNWIGLDSSMHQFDSITRNGGRVAVDTTSTGPHIHFQVDGND